MPNNFENPTWIMNKFAARVHNKLAFAANVTRDYDDQFVVKGAKVGDTVYARVPQLWDVTDGDDLVMQNVEDITVPVTITDHVHIGMNLTVREKMLNEDNFLERYVYGSADKIANAIDQRGLQRMTRATYNHVGTPGTVPNANSTYLNAGVKLTQLGAPQPRSVCLTAQMLATIMNANTANFHPGGKLEKGWSLGTVVGPALNIKEWWEDENVNRHLIGTQTGSPTVNGANQTGTSMILQSTSASATFLEGNVVNFAGCNAVNPLSKQSTGQLADFRVTTDVTATAGGAVTLTIEPGIVTSGAQQNVTASPTNGGAVTIFGNANTNSGVTTAQGLLFHKSAYALVFADAPLFTSAAVAERVRDADLGISFTMHKQFRIGSFDEPCRIDAFFGWAAIRPAFGCRISSSAQ